LVASRKETSAPDSEQSPAVSQQSAAGCLARLFWTLGGNMALVFGALFIAQAPARLSIYDLAYWGIALLLVATRYVDITHLGGTTADGEPATLSHWRRYTFAVLGICAAIWVMAHLGTALIRP
jgi:hypothetical protein